ncbi:glycosyltransferase [Brevifollis gellanilyticus]|uniref:Rhamnosyltransferase subunit B n=1 Tax=Brevifollis gellanilyticus TaxID=748831 RepID=A0A512M7W6_9BACT|nr:glycosyltransferase [Brevifollis gellanilyticus]GEP42441.1 rhamnosyltransferase subunit B [Brevifollis gellanilyticus]
MAHIALLPFGSAGDVFPFLWLGRLLKKRGHRVTMIVACIFEEVARKAGMEVIPLGDAKVFEQLIADPRIWKLYEGTKMVFEFAGQSTETFLEPIEQRQGTADAFDLMLAPCTAFGARLARESLGIPLINVHLQPAIMISAHDMPVLLPGMQHFNKLPLWLRQWLVKLPNPADRFAAPMVAKACAKRDVKPPKSLWWDWAHSPDGTLCVFPEWFAKPQPDWPEGVKQWDFPLEDLATEQPLSEELRRFLAAGEKPIIFTPGSANVHAKRFFEVAYAAVTRLQKRALFVTRKLDQLPPNLPNSILPVEYVPFSNVLPQSAVFVHHGGIGTLSQGFAAGVPQLIMAMAHDQPDNAWRLTGLGAGLGLTPRSFTPDRVSSALERLLNEPAFSEAARACQKLTLARRDQAGLAGWIESRVS